MSDLLKFGPTQANHPVCGQVCPACDFPIMTGDYTTLIPLGPGDDPEEQDKCREGKPYKAVSAVVHWMCATGEAGAAETP